MPKYLVTGTGGCGTGFFMHMMRRAGYQTGFELIHGPNEKQWSIDQNECEVSWYSGARLDDPRTLQYDPFIIHLVRDPIKTIKTWMTRCQDFTLHHFNGRYINRFLPNIANYARCLDRAIYFYIHWNKLIENGAHTRVKLENAVGEFEQIIPPKMGPINYETIPIDHQTEGKKVDFDAEKADLALMHELKISAKRYGYNLAESIEMFAAPTGCYENAADY